MKSINTGRSTISAAIGLCLASAAVGMAGTAMAAASAPTGTMRVIVVYKNGGGIDAMASPGLARDSVKLELAELGAVVAEVSPKALAQLRKDPRVEYVEEDVKRYPLALPAHAGNYYRRGQLIPYGIRLVQADRLPDTYAANRMLCIIDSGYDLSHEDLGGNTVSGVNDRGTGNWFIDENHHGTHVAGTIAAINNTHVGVVGVAPNRKLKLHIVKVFGADGWAYSSTLANAARQCGKAGANVISMSLGGASPSRTEQRAFERLAARGVLSVAAAGNDGTSALLYPAAYASVMMVGALDEQKAWAPFSQFNAKVELSAPGVNVLSTVPMGTGTESTLKVAASVYAPGSMDGSPKTTASAPLAPFGTGETIDPSVSGKVCLIARGNIPFGAKVANCQASGGVGAIIYNNAPGSFNGTLGTTVTTIASVTASDTEGAAMQKQLGTLATLAVKPINYAYYNGTSMATPHVAAVAALVWSHYPGCNGKQMRASLTRSALDLGTPGRDDKFGYGLVQAKAAFDRIGKFGCGN